MLALVAAELNLGTLARAQAHLLVDLGARSIRRSLGALPGSSGSAGGRCTRALSSSALPAGDTGTGRLVNFIESVRTSLS